MAIQRTQAELQTLLHDNSTGDITPAIMRDLARSINNNGIGYLYSLSTTATAGALTFNGTDTITMNKVDLNGNNNKNQLDVLLVINNILTLFDTANNSRVDAKITAISFASSVYTLTVSTSVNDGSLAVNDFILCQITSATGTTDHAALSNLSYASSGHTGFASSATTISAGTGLSGGGDLSTNRTISLSTPISLSNGGTNATTANNALNNLLPSQSSNSGKVLQTDGSNTSWQSASSLPSSAGHANAILRTDGSSASWCDNFTVASSGNCDCKGTFLCEGSANFTSGLSIPLGNLVVQVGTCTVGSSASFANGNLSIDSSANIYTSANASFGSLTGPSEILPLKNSGGTAASLQWLERSSDPSAPGSGQAILYLIDNGSGKAELRIQFPTGSPIAIATEL